MSPEPEPGALGEVPVLILAAGKGTRLGELGRESPKALIPIAGRPLLDLHLEHLAREGVRRAVVNAHHLAEQIRDHVSRYAGELQLEVLVEPTLLGTAGAAINALRKLGSDSLLVLYGDVVMFEPLAPLMRAHTQAGALATICVYEHDDTAEKGVVEVDASDRVLRFSEKDRARTGPGLVNAGLYVVQRDALAPFPAETFLDFGHDVFPAMLSAGQRIQAHRIPEPVLDIGTPADLAKARARSW